MEKIPPEILNNIVKNLEDDIISLKNLRLTCKHVCNAPEVYLYKRIVLYNDIVAWKNFRHVASHPRLCAFIQIVESTSLHDQTCIHSHIDSCRHRVTRGERGYLNWPFRFAIEPAEITLKIFGFRHLLGEKLTEVRGLGNIRKLDLDLSFLDARDAGCLWECDPVPLPRWIHVLSSGVRELNLTLCPTYFEREVLPFFLVVDFLWLFIEGKWKGLEKLSIKHAATSVGNLKLFLRNQCETLTDLKIIEPVLKVREWEVLQGDLHDLLPKLEKLECTDSYAPNLPAEEAQSFFDRMLWVIFPVPSR